MPRIQPQPIHGRWSEGFALDLHTLSSVPIGENEWGHMQFETEYSEVGALLKEVKYRSRDPAKMDQLVHAAAAYIREWGIQVDLVVPVPPSKWRSVQPVQVMGAGLAAALGVQDGSGCVLKVKESPELKGISDSDERVAALDGVFEVDEARTQNRRVLLFDDLFRSGTTMNAIAELLRAQGGAAEVYALTLTKTRSHR